MKTLSQKVKILLFLKTQIKGSNYSCVQIYQKIIHVYKYKGKHSGILMSRDGALISFTMQVKLANSEVYAN